MTYAGEAVRHKFLCVDQCTVKEASVFVMVFYIVREFDLARFCGKKLMQKSPILIISKVAAENLVFIHLMLGRKNEKTKTSVYKWCL